MLASFEVRWKIPCLSPGSSLAQSLPSSTLPSGAMKSQSGGPLPTLPKRLALNTISTALCPITLSTGTVGLLFLYGLPSIRWRTTSVNSASPQPSFIPGSTTIISRPSLIRSSAWTHKPTAVLSGEHHFTQTHPFPSLMLSTTSDRLFYSFSWTARGGGMGTGKPLPAPFAFSSLANIVQYRACL